MRGPDFFIPCAGITRIRFGGIKSQLFQLNFSTLMKKPTLILIKTMPEQLVRLHVWIERNLKLAGLYSPPVWNKFDGI